MKIAVLMSTYNGEKYLSKQLESLANQTVKDCIILYIRDDGSIDKTIDIIKFWGEKIKICLYRNSNLGPARSFWELLTNKDITADYYAFCDQDDIWDSDKLEVAITQLEQEHAQLFLSNCRLIDSSDEVIEDRYRINFPDMSLNRQFISGFAQGCCMVFTNSLREYFLKNKIECIPMHDTVVIIHAIKFGKIIWESKPMFSYRIHSNNVVAKSNKNILKNLKNTYLNWKNSSEHSMSKVANEVLLYCNNLNDEEIEYLNLVKNYKRNFKSQCKLIHESNFENVPSSHVRSFVIRVLLKLL